MASIQLEELKQIMEKAFAKIAFYAGKSKTIDLGDVGNYWNAPPPESYDMKSEPKLSVGDLNDDISSLKKLLADSERETTFVDVDRLASLLTAISHQSFERVNWPAPCLSKTAHSPIIFQKLFNVGI